MAEQTKPVCFIAHNGDNFDFPILKSKIEDLCVPFIDGVLCIDSLTVFRGMPEIFGQQKSPKKVIAESLSSGSSCLTPEILPSNTVSNLTSLDFKSVETTPPALSLLLEMCGSDEYVDVRRFEQLEKRLITKCEAATRRDPKKKLSYGLGAVYQRIFNVSIPHAHSAEGDCLALLQLFHRTNTDVIPWVDDHAKPF